MGRRRSTAVGLTVHAPAAAATHPLHDHAPPPSPAAAALPASWTAGESPGECHLSNQGAVKIKVSLGIKVEFIPIFIFLWS